MPECIARITRIRFDKKSTWLLGFEAFIFAVIYALMFKTWLVWAILFLPSAILLSNPKTAVYTIFIICGLWTFIFAALGYGVGGWIGVMIVGMTVFYNGVRLHLRDLKRSFDELDVVGHDWRQNWHFGRQNLN